MNGEVSSLIKVLPSLRNDSGTINICKERVTFYIWRKSKVGFCCNKVCTVKAEASTQR